MIAASPEMELNLFALRRARVAGERIPFTDVDTFAGQPSDPTHLHKYLYTGSNPVMTRDPSGHDFSLTGLLVTAGISGTLSATLTGAYGYAKGWSAGQIAKAATYSFFAGALAGGVVYGLAWGIAAGAAIASGFTAAQASFYASIGWTAAGLITTPTQIGLAIGLFVNTWKDPNADTTDRTFASFNLGIAAFVFAGVHAEAFAGPGVAIPSAVNPQFKQALDVIRALPANQRLSGDQLSLLSENVRVLQESIRSNPNNPRVLPRALWLLENDARFKSLTPEQRAAFAERITKRLE